MSDRNWEQELAKIDKQLASVSDDQLLAQNAAQRAPLQAPTSGKNVPSAKSSAPVATAGRTPRGWVAWAQLTVAIAAGAGLWFWPWATRCGLNAISFTAATGAVTALGLWSAVGSWRHRQGIAHVLSFIVIVWGLVLGAREVLPRMGYAIPTLERPAGWGCDASTTLPVTLPPLPSPLPSPPPIVTPPSGMQQALPPAGTTPPGGTQPQVGAQPPVGTTPPGN